MKNATKIITVLLIISYIVLLPTTVSATEGLVPCTGADCGFCHLVSLGQNVLNWIFGIVFVIFGVLMVVAGFGLVTSAGNQSKLDEAKQKFSNAIIGIIIVFAAWLIVDTLLKAAIPEGDLSSVDTELGMWHTIDCSLSTQVTPAVGLDRIIRTGEDEPEPVDGEWVATGDTHTICVNRISRRCTREIEVPIEERTVVETRCVRSNRAGCIEEAEVEVTERRYPCEGEVQISCPDSGYRPI